MFHIYFLEGSEHSVMTVDADNFFRIEGATYFGSVRREYLATMPDDVFENSDKMEDYFLERPQHLYMNVWEQCQ